MSSSHLSPEQGSPERGVPVNDDAGHDEAVNGARSATGAGASRGEAPPTQASEAPAATERGSIGDLRVSDRAAITLRVDYKRLNTFFADYTKNISKGGTFIRTSKPLDVGTEFVFVLSVPSKNKQLDLKGEVMWCVSEENATPDAPAGMGIKFRYDTEQDRSRVDEFVEKLMEEALGVHISQKLLRRT